MMQTHFPLSDDSWMLHQSLEMTNISLCTQCTISSIPGKSGVAGLFPAISGKGPWQKLGKHDRLNSKGGRN